MMKKIILSAAALIIIFVTAGSAQQYQHNRKTAREMSQKNVRCHAAIDPKGLKGPAFKAEWASAGKTRTTIVDREVGCICELGATLRLTRC